MECLDSLKAIMWFGEPRLRPTVLLCGGKLEHTAILVEYVQKLLANAGKNCSETRLVISIWS